MYLLKMNQKNCRHLTQVFLLRKVTLTMVEKNFFILQQLYYALKNLGDTEKVASCKSKALPSKRLTTPTTTDNRLSPSIKS